MRRPTIPIAIAGIGNCASSLLQGLEFYRTLDPGGDDDAIGLMHYEVCGYRPADIEVVCAFDVDRRKVGKPVHEAAMAAPNCTRPIVSRLSPSRTVVQMGPVLDGVSEHMSEYPAEQTFMVAEQPSVDVTAALRRSGAKILVSYLPVGSQQATEHYARACLDAGVALVNCIPAFIASDPRWAREFELRGLPVVGDDIKSQLGATIVHRMLAKLFADRGMVIDSTYQLNVGGNTDFLNMLNRSRTKSKRTSKTEAVQSNLPAPLAADRIHIGPSDYVPFQRDNKLCFLRIEGRGFGNAPVELEMRLSVQDSPNSAGCVIDAIRCCQVALDRGLAGPLESISSYVMKHPPRQLPDDIAREQVERFIRAEVER